MNQILLYPVHPKKKNKILLYPVRPKVDGNQGEIFIDLFVQRFAHIYRLTINSFSITSISIQICLHSRHSTEQFLHAGKISAYAFLLFSSRGQVFPFFELTRDQAGQGPLKLK